MGFGDQPCGTNSATVRMPGVDRAPPRAGRRSAVHRARTGNRECGGGAWPLWHFAYEFVRFGIKQAWACLFAGLMLALIPRDASLVPERGSTRALRFLTLAAIGIQIVMLATRMETWEEARVIAAFHVVGTVMEIFKTSVGSWIYPEPSVLRIAGVPLFTTTTMYAAVGSFMARCWRLFDFRFTRHPPLGAGAAVDRHLHQLLHAPLHHGPALRPVRRGDPVARSGDDF